VPEASAGVLRADKLGRWLGELGFVTNEKWAAGTNYIRDDILVGAYQEGNVVSSIMVQFAERTHIQCSGLPFLDVKCRVIRLLSARGDIETDFARVAREMVRKVLAVDLDEYNSERYVIRHELPPY